MRLFLVGQKGLHVGVVQVDGALDRTHEGDRVLRQFDEAFAQAAQALVRDGRIGIATGGVLGHGLAQAGQEHDDVFERDGLQRAAGAQRDVVLRQGALGRLALPRHLIEHATAVEVLQRGDPAGVRKREQISPAGVGQPLQRVDDRIRADATVTVGAERGLHLFRADVDGEPLLLH
jgi:hypothetical protein